MLHNRTAPSAPHSHVSRQLNFPADYLLAGRMDVAMLATLGGLNPTANWEAIRREYHHHAQATTVYGQKDAEYRHL